jgi:hypothetical protein
MRRLSLCGAAVFAALLGGISSGFALPVASITAVDDFYSTPENTPLFGSSVLSNDTKSVGVGALLPAVQSPPGDGTLAFNSNGTFTYTPVQGFNGTDMFTYLDSGFDLT